MITHSIAIGGYSKRGFTLLEIIVVFLLIAIIIGVTAISVTQGMGSAKIRAASKDLMAALRYTRGQAIVSGQEQRLIVDVEKRTYQAPKKSLVELPKNMEMRLLTAAEEQTSESGGAIRFFPDGSSTGGIVRLISGEHEWKVEIAWLTGEVRLREGEADAP